MVKNDSIGIEVLKIMDAYEAQAMKQKRIAKRWIVITIYCLILAQCANIYFLSLESIEILKIVPINVISLLAISLSAGLARFHNMIAEKRDAEALKLYTLHNSDGAVKNKVKKASSSKPRPSPARR